MIYLGYLSTCHYAAYLLQHTIPQGYPVNPEGVYNPTSHDYVWEEQGPLHRLPAAGQRSLALIDGIDVIWDIEYDI